MIKPKEFTFSFDLKDFKTKKELILSVRNTRRISTDQTFLTNFIQGPIEVGNEPVEINRIILMYIDRSDGVRVYFRFELNENTTRHQLDNVVANIFSLGKDPFFTDSIETDGSAYSVDLDSGMELMIYGEYLGKQND